MNSDSDENNVNILNQNYNDKDKKKRKKNKSKNSKVSQNVESNKSKPISAMGKLIAERKKLEEKENERIRKLEEDIQRKIKEEEEKLEELKKKEEEEKEKKRKAKQDKIEEQKKSGTYKTKAEKERYKKNKKRLEEIQNHGIITTDGRIIIKQNIKSPTEHDKQANNENEKNEVNEVINNFRCPIFTIMGHVDTGKTTLLDYLRKTTVQSYEAGGITQQIGATLLTSDIILKQVEIINKKKFELKIPGLLLVDTPGHEAFKILRKLGSKLADIAILIIDIMHGLEPQTIESIKLLEESKTPFMIALNKIDRLYGWNKNLNDLNDLNDLNYLEINNQIFKQDSNTLNEFYNRFNQIKTQIMTQGLNCDLFWDNNSYEDTINIIPISAVSGQGIPDLLNCIINYSQNILYKQITMTDVIECIAMDITDTEGYGYTLDCILKNGEISKGDVIQFHTSSGNIVETQIKNILTIPVNKDSKSSSSFKYILHQKIKCARQIKIVASNLETCQIGTEIKILNKKVINNTIDINVGDNEIIDIKKDVEQLSEINNIKLDTQGICIFTSTRGSMESFVQFIRNNTELINPIKISYLSIGNVNKKELNKFYISNISNSVNKVPIPENMCVLVFEVEIEKEAIDYAESNNIKIFKDETIYRLFNQYKDHANKLYIERKEKMKNDTVFPCILKIIENNIFNKKNPLIMGVEVIEGTLNLGTPLIILPSKTFIGKVIGIQINKKDVNIGRTGQFVCIKVDNQTNTGIMYGRHFTHNDLLYSNITRASIDILKEYFKNDVSREDIGLLVKLKKLIGF